MGKGLDEIQYIADFSPLRLELELDNENELDQLGLELRLNPITVKNDEDGHLLWPG